MSVQEVPGGYEDCMELILKIIQLWVERQFSMLVKQNRPMVNCRSAFNI
jgi:hypothetical protein